MPSILIESAQILAGNDLTKAHIVVEDGRIKSVSKLRPPGTFDLKINADGLIALPGLIDVHVHLRDLEFSYKETFETGTQAAAAGGFTTVLDMPNTRPATTSSMAVAERISKAVGRLFSNVAFQGALVEDRSETKRMVEKGAIAFKLYLNKALETFDSSDEAKLRNALQGAKDANALVTVHAEDGTMIKKIQQRSQAHGRTSIRDFLKAHGPEMEVSAVRRILNLSRRMALRVHICHISIPAAVKLVRKWRYATCEATAHHLLLNNSVLVKQGPLATCVPPIRNERQRRGLWRLFSKGEVDILASDHAPHTLEEKTREDVWSVPSGVPGLETSLPVLFTQVSEGKLSLPRLVEATATNPAKIFRLARKGALKEGYDADIVLIDPKAKTRIDPKNFLSKARYSPFKGMQCTGKAVYTIVNGALIVEKGHIVGPPVGKTIKSDSACISS